MRHLVYKIFTPVLFMFLNVTINAQNCSPLLQDIYSFPIGSVFQYKTTNTHEAPYEEIITEKYTVTDKQWNNDTLFYTRAGIKKFVMYSLPDYEIDVSWTESFNNIIKIIDSTDHFLNACDSQLITLNPYYEYFSYVKINHDEKIIGGPENLFEYDENDSLVTVSGLPPEIMFNFTEIYKPGLGLTLRSEGNILSSRTIELQGYIIYGDTTGIVSEDQELDIKQVTYNDFKIYPNPTNGKVFVNCNNQNKCPDIIRIYDITGKEVMNFKETSSQFNISELKEGIYIIRMEINKTTMIQKKLYKK